MWGQGPQTQTDGHTGRQIPTWFWELGTSPSTTLLQDRSDIKQQGVSVSVALGYYGNQGIMYVCVDLLGCLLMSSVRLEVLFPGEPWTHTYPH